MTISQLLAIAKALGDKLPQAWPYILAIADNVRKILAILNGGKELAGASGTTTMSDQSDAFIVLAEQHGINPDEARRTAAALEHAEDHFNL